MQLRFRIPAHEQVAQGLGFTAEALLHCANAGSLQAAREALDRLRADVKAAYRRRALALHPDRHPGDAAKEEEFKVLSAAYHDIEVFLGAVDIQPKPVPVRPVVRVTVVHGHGANATNSQVTTTGNTWFSFDGGW